MQTFDSFEDGYAVGWEEGRQTGYAEGYTETTQTYEQRLSAFFAELATLNARIDYLESKLTKEEK